MKVTTRPSTRKSAKPEPSHRAGDILGVLLLALAALAFLSLLLGSTGVIGQALGGALRLFFGKGAWAMPVVVAVLGIASIGGRRSAGITHLTIGLIIIFLALVGSFAKPIQGDFFDIDAVRISGGYFGAVIGWLTATLFGSARIVALGATMMIGAILCIDVPIKSLFNALRDRSLRPSKALQDRRATNNSARAVVSPATRHIGGTTQGLDTQSAPSPNAREDAIDDAPAQKKFKWTESKATGPDLHQDVSVPKEGYTLPPLSLLSEPTTKQPRSKQEMQKNIETLEGTLEQFGIEANVVEVATGPTVTRYEIQLGPGVKVARITALADNIAMDLAASQVRVEAPIPGKAAIGVEVPNPNPTQVSLRELCDSKEFREHPSRLAIALGKDVSGVNRYADLTKMPHLLIGGATNSGKSIGLSTIITSLLMRNTPKDLRLVMIDPKRVELTLFDRIPHLMCPVIKDVKETPGVLRAVWREMDRRYDVFSEAGVRNIDGWNSNASFQDKMPYIVVIIDELADLMIQSPAEVETSICRLAQLARATGIHLVIATQRPSVDVITGTIKANIASRIAFTVSSQIDSRTILDSKGAENLIGRGDMLFLPIDASKPLRVQGCYVSEAEIAAVCRHWREQEGPAYTLQPETDAADPKKESGDFGDQMDPLWQDAVRWAVERGQASTSMLQRKFSIGFQRASRLLDLMEERQIVGPRDGPRPREVLLSPHEADELFGTAASHPRFTEEAPNRTEAWD